MGWKNLDNSILFVVFFNWSLVVEELSKKRYCWIRKEKGEASDIKLREISDCAVRFVRLFPKLEIFTYHYKAVNGSRFWLLSVDELTPELIHALYIKTFSQK